MIVGKKISRRTTRTTGFVDDLGYHYVQPSGKMYRGPILSYTESEGNFEKKGIRSFIYLTFSIMCYKHGLM